MAIVSFNYLQNKYSYNPCWCMIWSCLPRVLRKKFIHKATGIFWLKEVEYDDLPSSSRGNTLVPPSSAWKINARTIEFCPPPSHFSGTRPRFLSLLHKKPFLTIYFFSNTYLQNQTSCKQIYTLVSVHLCVFAYYILQTNFSSHAILIDFS